MPKQYVAMRNAFKADGLSDKKARSKAAAIYNSKHKDHPVTNKEENIMTRLTREDIRKLLENIDTRFTHTASSGRGAHSDLSRGESLAQQTREAGVVQKKAEKNKPKFSFTRTDLKGGREISSLGTTDDITTAFKGAHGGYATDSEGKIVYKHRKQESIKTYYKQLKESWWCGNSNEELIQTTDYTDPTYTRYAAIQKDIAAGRRITAKNLNVISKTAKKIPHPLGQAVSLGAKLQKNVIEDTMTGDIGAVAVPFVAPGESEDERNKKRKKRRKLATIMAVSTGSIDGTGN